MKRIAWNSVTLCLVTVVALLWMADRRGGSVHADQPPSAEKKPAVDPPETQSMSFWMEKKLDHSQAILRALATSDFESLQTNAQQMQLLNRVEGFVRSRNPEYRVQLHTFERVTGELERQAKRKNIEGATLAFNQLTVSCVRCHETLRAINGDTPTEPATPAGADQR